MFLWEQWWIELCDLREVFLLSLFSSSASSLKTLIKLSNENVLPGLQKYKILNPFYSFLIFLLIDIPRRERRKLGMLLIQSPILGLHSIQNRVGGREQVEDDQCNIEVEHYEHQEMIQVCHTDNIDLWWKPTDGKYSSDYYKHAYDLSFGCLMILCYKEQHILLCAIFLVFEFPFSPNENNFRDVFFPHCHLRIPYYSRVYILYTLY